ncbi:hypothetical protein FJ567_05695 [Mesorhizobium sp. B2-4-16]|nr:hypothetical protein FJ567_05410 [Mesorhizobium sp. B2-4-16]TPL03774.1 hypothetical protein FJ567_05695 [Mesorhizobium sp. B2-4-16]TPL72625.1 hypothetical protein FJ956_11375 [Mesorhizobium sp. B2-4-3]
MAVFLPLQAGGGEQASGRAEGIGGPWDRRAWRIGCVGDWLKRLRFVIHGRSKERSDAAQTLGSMP